MGGVLGGVFVLGLGCLFLLDFLPQERWFCRTVGRVRVQKLAWRDLV